MIIGEVNLSYPCIKYNVSVSHFTSRRSTAIEWVILEAIKKSNQIEHYAGVSVDVLFEQIFSISDSDLLVKPCLFSLQDMGAIVIDQMDDETPLSTIPMRNLKLTATGEKMQNDGLLPGTMAEDSFTIYYELINNCLVQNDANYYKTQPNGIQICEIDDIEKVNFPSGTVKNFIDENKFGKRTFPWLHSTTTVSDVTPINTEVYWKNIVKKMQIKEGLTFSINDNIDENLNDLVLETNEFSGLHQYEDAIVVNVYNPDKELNKIFAISDLNDVINDYMRKDDFFVVSEKFYIESSTDQLSKKKKKRIAIVYDAEKLAVMMDKRYIVVKVPGTVLSQEIAYQNDSCSICYGKFPLSSKNSSREIVFGYIPINNKISLVDTCISIVDKHYKEDYTVLFLLIELGLKDAFQEYVRRSINAKNAIREKADDIDKINQLCLKYYNEKFITSATIEKILIDEADILNKCHSIDGMLHVIAEIKNINLFIQNERLYQALLSRALPQVQNVGTLKSIWKLWQEINSTKRSHLLWINKNNLFKNLYSADVLDQLFTMVDNGELQKDDEYTVVEQTVLQMGGYVKNLQIRIPELNVSETYSDERVFEIIMSHKDELAEIYDDIRKWNDVMDIFNSKVADFSKFVDKSIYLSKVIKVIDQITDALKVFFDDSVIKYQKIYIVDTSSLMNAPELISWFDDGKALLVIPQIVLNELDGLKESCDEKVAYQAREAIRTISNYRAYEWVNIKEQSHPELISSDLDKESGDSKILSIAIKYIVKKPIIITEDINFRNIAESHSIESMNLNSYMSMKKHEKLNDSKHIKKKNKSKK